MGGGVVTVIGLPVVAFTFSLNVGVLEVELLGRDIYTRIFSVHKKEL